MKKFSYFLSAALVAFAASMVSCSIEDNAANGQDTRVKDAAELITAIQSANDGTLIELAPNAEITLTEELPEITKKVYILGVESAPAKIIMGEKGFTFASSFNILNVEIDATALTSPLFAFSATPNEELKVESGQYVIKDPIVIKNVTVNHLVKAFVADNGKSYSYVDFTVSDCLIQLDTQKNVVFNFASSMPIHFNLTKSTVYSKESGTGNFIAMSGKRPWQTTGFEEETGKFTCANNTFYNVAKSKQFMNTNTLKGQKYLYEFNNNIFVDCSNKKIYGNMTNNKNQLTASNNTYWYDGAAFAETNYNGDEGLKTDPAFKDAANGDFTPTGAEQVANQTGDPRWFK